MSWIKKAFSIALRDPDSRYVVADPVDFYEWRHLGVIPKGTPCLSFLPPSDTFTQDVIIASVQATADDVENGKLKADITGTPQLKIGYMPSPRDLLQRFDNLEEEQRRKLDFFKQTCLSQQYVTLDDEGLKLYRVVPSGENVRLQSYGDIEDIQKKIAELRQALGDKSQAKTGRAYEMADWRRLENVCAYLDDKTLPLDASKISFLLEQTTSKPKSDKIVSWADCHSALNPEARDMQERMKKFKSLHWVRDMVPPFPR